MGYAFVSYSRDDQAYVQRLASELSRQGIEVWFDVALVPGDAFGQAIQDAIDRCGALIVVLSPAAVASQWVQREYTYALAEGKSVLTVLLEDCRVPNSLTGLRCEDVRASVSTPPGLPGSEFVAELRAHTSITRATT